LFSSSMPTRDGNLLANEAEQHKSPRIVGDRVGLMYPTHSFPLSGVHSPVRPICGHSAPLPSIRGRLPAAKLSCG
jgi:hypothetical protein